MCGLTGFLVFKSFSKVESVNIANQMSQQMKHRGPDSSGVWVDEDIGIALAHRRLSIVDLSEAGHQPMESTSGRFVITFNGEIYNHLELRKELEKRGRFHWRGKSDTESLLAGIEEWGLEFTLRSVIGMFAIALWDRKERELYLARDRMGEKPLYYGWQKGIFLFGSELKSLSKHPSFEAEIDRNSLALYFRHNYIPTPYSIYKGIQKLTPGNYIKISEKNQNPEERAFWNLGEVVKSGLEKPFIGSEEEAIDTLHSQLLESVKMQMEADVPLGAFLSGGIDSSMIVALMQAQSTRPVKTFTIGFHEIGYNEAQHAKSVANHLGTDHTELYISPKEAIDVIPKLPSLFDEPFSDSSQIPTYLVSKLAKQKVSVSLSGDAGDELFGGYNRYFWTKKIWNKIKFLPHPIRVFISSIFRSISPKNWNSIINQISLHSNRLKISQPGDKIHKLAELLLSKNYETIYYNLISQWKNPEEIVLHSKEWETILNGSKTIPNFNDIEHKMMYLDSLTYLPDDILVKVDRASMGVSLESRVPFLDHRVVELAWKLPLSLKIKNGQGKWILRQVLYNYIPKKLIERPKMGFGVPIDSWLRGPLREWSEELVSENKLKKDGFLAVEPVRRKWSEHLVGSHNWQHQLWTVLMFQAWVEENSIN